MSKYISHNGIKNMGYVKNLISDAINEYLPIIKITKPNYYYFIEDSKMSVYERLMETNSICIKANSIFEFNILNLALQTLFDDHTGLAQSILEFIEEKEEQLLNNEKLYDEDESDYESEYDEGSDYGSEYDDEGSDYGSEYDDEGNELDNENDDEDENELDNENDDEDESELDNENHDEDENELDNEDRDYYNENGSSEDIDDFYFRINKNRNKCYKNIMKNRRLNKIKNRLDKHVSDSNITINKFFKYLFKDISVKYDESNIQKEPIQPEISSIQIEYNKQICVLEIKEPKIFDRDIIEKLLSIRLDSNTINRVKILLS